jgi:hypothetical protein
MSEIPFDIEELPHVPSFWYLATPYSGHEHGMEVAAIEAAQMTGWLQDRGVPVFCPILHGHAASKYMELPHTYDMWLSIDRPFMTAAWGIIVGQLSNWHSSHGIIEERKFFAQMSKPHTFMGWPQ